MSEFCNLACGECLNPEALEKLRRTIDSGQAVLRRTLDETIDSAAELSTGALLALGQDSQSYSDEVMDILLGTRKHLIDTTSQMDVFVDQVNLDGETAFEEAASIECIETAPIEKGMCPRYQRLHQFLMTSPKVY